MKYPTGSEWRKWDLHVHTTASDGKANPTQVVEHAIASGVSVIAITDHHTAANVDEVKRLASEAGGQVTVISGIEFRTELGKSSVHMIGLFPDEYQGQRLTASALHELVLCPLGLSRTAIVAEGRKYSDSDNEDQLFKTGMFKLQVNFQKAADLIRQYGGLVSVHNGTKTNGIDDQMRHDGRGIRDVPLSESLGPLKEELLNKYVDICEVKKAEEAQFYLTQFGLPSIVASDAHEINEIGMKPVWIKADPTFDGLRQILFEPADRVRIQTDKPEQKAAYQTLKSVSLNEDGFWNQPLSLNSGLVAIIGGRSSGKSNLLSAIACKAGCVELQNEDEASSSLSFVKQHLADISIKWSDDVDDHERMVEYFPQGYMIGIADNPDRIEPVVWGILKENVENQRQKEAFDRKINELKSAIVSDCSNLFTQRDLLRTLDAEIKERGGVKSHEAEVCRVKGEMANLQKQHMNMNDEELRDFEQIKEQERSLVAKVKTIEEDLTSLTTIAELSQEDFFPRIDMPLLSENVQGKIEKKIREIQQRGYTSWQDLIAEETKNLTTQRDNANQQLRELRAEELYKKGAKHISENAQLNDLEKRLRQEEDLLADVKKIADKRNDVVKRNDETIQSLARHHYELYDCSRKFADATKLEKDELSITGNVVVERNALDRFIDGRMTRVSKAQKDWYEKILQHDSFSEDEVKNFLKQTMQCAVQYNKDVDEKTVVVELLSTCWFRVSYDIEYQDDKFVEMSPGKRSFVILQLLLEFSNKQCPILIDQPEDNLDNRAIFRDLVSYLRTKKKERQIILVTHNPNVVVGADAEQVIVANQHGNDSENADNVRFAYAVGSLEASWPKITGKGPVLESQGIREHVCEILEGGEEAFRKRESKYGLQHK